MQARKLSQLFSWDKQGEEHTHEIFTHHLRFMEERLVTFFPEALPWVSQLEQKNKQAFLANPTLNHQLLKEKPGADWTAWLEGAQWENRWSERLVLFDFRSSRGECFSFTSSMALPSEEEVVLIKNKIEGVQELLKENNALYYLVDQFVQKIEIWTDPRFGIMSSSTGDYNFRVLLRNAHSESVDIAVMAEWLIHEAIHFVLNCYEIEQAFVQPQYRKKQRTRFVLSRWTQRQIEFHSYLHACFVWFGLAGFAQLFLSHPKLNEHTLKRLQYTSTRGFLLGGKMSDLLGVSANWVRPSLLSEINELQSLVRNQFERRFLGSCRYPLLGVFK